MGYVCTAHWPINSQHVFQAEVSDHDHRYKYMTDSGIYIYILKLTTVSIMVRYHRIPITKTSHENYFPELEKYN